MKTVKNVLVLSIGLFASAHMTVVTAASVGSSGVGAGFSRGTTSIGVVFGSAAAFNEDYLILGLGIGYYVANGLELGIDAQRWISGSPEITKISPQLKYVFTRAAVKPYIGSFYRYTHIDGIGDQDSYGYRAGAYFSGNSGVYIGAGFVHEEFVDCPQFSECSSTYPEALISVNF